MLHALENYATAFLSEATGNRGISEPAAFACKYAVKDVLRSCFSLHDVAFMKWWKHVPAGTHLFLTYAFMMKDNCHWKKMIT